MITARDLLAPPDEDLTLEVEVERRILPFFDPPIAGAEVEIEGLGRAVTDAAGIARFSLGRLSAGLHRYRMRGGPEALVAVVPREATIFVTDIDRTISDASPLSQTFQFNPRPHPIAGAPEALREIARTMTLLYLTARDHIFTAKTKEWLRLNGFPEGPVYLRRRRLWSASPRDHKIERLAELRPRFTNLRWGVGDTIGDLEAYATHSMTPILLSPSPVEGLPPGALRAPGWPHLLDMIK